MAENRVTQIVGQTLHEHDSELRLTQIVGQVLYTADGGIGTPDPPKVFKPGGYGVQILD